MTKEEAYNQLKDLIEDRKSFLSGDNKADDLFLKDIESIKIALKIIEKLNEIKEYISKEIKENEDLIEKLEGTSSFRIVNTQSKIKMLKEILEIIERGNRE